MDKLDHLRQSLLINDIIDASEELRKASPIYTQMVHSIIMKILHNNLTTKEEVQKYLKQEADSRK